jgi:CubicO group peptidase (beta-lactamase class C family)
MLLNIISRYKSILHVVGILMIGMPLTTIAQRGKVFTINGKDIDVDKFNQEVIYIMNEVGVPGISLAVIDNNDVVFYNAYGVKRQRTNKSVNRKTIFEGCSLSKSFLVFVVYQLVEEGKLSLDKPLYQYLEYQRLQHDPLYKLITARMVLSHSSGLENWQYMNNSDTLDILSNPGEKYIYSGEGYEYLAKVVERILNQPYEEYVYERVIRPLKLKNTYVKYREKTLNPFRKTSPANFAVGHEVFGQQRKFNNTFTLPAAGNHFTAEDYARLIIATFDHHNLSSNRIKDILTPIVQINNSPVHYGSGFEVFYTDHDTIIAHGGDNPGFKNRIIYSVTKKRGLVILTNSDRGNFMSAKLAEMALGLNITTYLESLYYFEQYPSTALTLLKIYDRVGKDSMFVQLDKLKNEKNIGSNSLPVLSHLFRIGGDVQTAKRLLEDNIEVFPDSPIAYVLLGDLYLQKDEYELAFKNFKKAKALNFDRWEIDDDLMACEKGIADTEQRKKFLFKIPGNEEAVLQAENYNVMSGVKLGNSEAGPGQIVGYLDDGDWMEYKVNSSLLGTYSVTCRVASQHGGGRVEFRSGATLLAAVEVPSTKEWENWVPLATNINLEKGDQTIRLFVTSGGFNLDWMKFSLVGKSDH